MKTVSEAEKELENINRKQNNRDTDRAMLWKKYLEHIERKDIPVYQPDKRNSMNELVDKTDYSKLRQGARDHIKGVHIADRTSGSFIDIVCDDCKTMLFDSSPQFTLMSNPPKFWAECVGCGRRYALNAALRKHVDPMI